MHAIWIYDCLWCRSITYGPWQKAQPSENKCCRSYGWSSGSSSWLPCAEVGSQWPCAAGARRCGCRTAGLSSKQSGPASSSATRWCCSHSRTLTCSLETSWTRKPKNPGKQNETQRNVLSAKWQTARRAWVTGACDEHGANCSCKFCQVRKILFLKFTNCKFPGEFL